MVSKYKIGDIVDGGITGIVDFGIFIKIDDNLEGLAHLRAGLVLDRKAVGSFQSGGKSESPNNQYR